MGPLLTMALSMLAVLVAVFGLLHVQAGGLPAGLLRDVAGFLPDCVLLLWHLHRDPVVPCSTRIAALSAVLWVLMPIPPIGRLDDVLIVALALRSAARRVPRGVLEAGWDGDRRVLALLIGPAPVERMLMDGRG